MNDKIKNLILDAQKEAAKETQANSFAYESLVYEKFAELIVEECAQAFKAEVDTWKEMKPYQGSMKRKGIQAIKQHFGVEE